MLILLQDVSYLATEPSEGFLSVLQNQCPGLETMACSAVDIPLPDNSVQVDTFLVVTSQYSTGRNIEGVRERELWK